MKNTQVKNKLNKIKIIKIAETLAAVHTGVCHLVNKSNVKYAENIKVNNNYKDRTMLKIGNMGLSLFVFLKQHKRWRAGPIILNL